MAVDDVDDAESRFDIEWCHAYLVHMDEKTKIQLEAAVLRRLIQHLRDRPSVQNIELMNLAGFCRNCLSNWMEDAAKAEGVALSRDDARQHVYGMPYDEWKSKHQREATADQAKNFEQKKH